MLGERWIGYDPRELKHLDNAVERILVSGAKAIILNEVAEDGSNKKDCFFRHIKLSQDSDTDCAIDRNSALIREPRSDVDRIRYWNEIAQLLLSRSIRYIKWSIILSACLFQHLERTYSFSIQSTTMDPSHSQDREYGGDQEES